MTDTKIAAKTHPTESELADFLDNSMPDEAHSQLEGHIAGCDECLEKLVSAHESVESFLKNKGIRKERANFMKKINVYLILTIISFALSFVVPRYFIQFLVATLLLGIKWVADSKSTKMLVMIYEAWKKGGDKEAGHLLKTLEPGHKNRL